MENTISNPEPNKVVEPVSEDKTTFVYTTDIFLKYKEANRKPHPNFDKYFDNSVGRRKMVDPQLLSKPDVQLKLNYIITKKNITNEDETLFNNIRYNLNKVNNRMLVDSNDKGLRTTIQALTSLSYTKVEHFQKLADMIVDKAVSEHNFCGIYATLCYELSPYYIEINQNKKIYFRHILLNTCQTTFESFLNNCEKIEKERLMGLMNLLGELYNKKLLTFKIIKACFDKLGLTLEKSNNSAYGMAQLVMSTYESLQKETPDLCKYIKAKLNEHADNSKLHIRSKFAIQNALDKIHDLE